MTMPHLMNCGHSDDGWCLACVKTLEDERYNTVIEAGKYEYALQAALQREETAEKQLAQLSEQNEKLIAVAKAAKETLLMLESRGMPDKFCDPIRTALAELGVNLEDR